MNLHCVSSIDLKILQKVVNSLGTDKMVINVKPIVDLLLFLISFFKESKRTACLEAPASLAWPYMKWKK